MMQCVLQFIVPPRESGVGGILVLLPLCPDMDFAITSQTVITENFTFHNTLNQDRHTHTDETKDRLHHVTVELHLCHIIKPTIKHTHPD